MGIRWLSEMTFCVCVRRAEFGIMDLQGSSSVMNSLQCDCGFAMGRLGKE